MGDLPPGSRPPALDNATTGLARDGNPSASSPYKSPDNNAPFYSQLSAISQGQLRPDFRSPTHPTAQYQSQEHSMSSMNMGAMAGALPEYGSFDEASVIPQSIPRSLSGASTSAVAYQLGQNLQQMPAHASSNLSPHPSYGPGFAPSPYQQSFMPSQGSQHGAYPPFGANQTRLNSATSMQTPYQNYPQASQYMYYSPYSAQGQFVPGFAAQAAQGHGMYGRRPSLTNTSVGIMGPGTEFSHIEGSFPGARAVPGNPQGEVGSFGSNYGVPFVQATGKRTTAQVGHCRE